MNLTSCIQKIQPLDQQAAQKAQDRWNGIAKPLNSLGLLERNIIKIAGITGNQKITLTPRSVIVMCADNGVVEEGVTQVGQEVTAIVTENMSSGDTSVCHMASLAKAEVIPVNIGVAAPVTGEKVLQRLIRKGTANMAKGPAMTKEEAVAAIETGIDLVCQLHQKGYHLLATGEMGIGNTTTSSAVTAVLLDKEVEAVTGRGSGLSSDGLQKKISAIKKAVALNQPDPEDGVDVLAKVGGLDIAGLTGVFLGGALCRIPVLIDGFISAAAALVAATICPTVKEYLLASHFSKEPAVQMIMEALDLHPFLYAEMCLGEGTGAVAAMPVLDMALEVYNAMSTFQEVEIEAYQPLV